MSFAENLKQLRKEHLLSQEDLAELLDVSRQAVSKWEQDQGYPEVEKLLLLSSKLSVSLDALMGTGIGNASAEKNTPFLGYIQITSPHENTIATCYKISTCKFSRCGKRTPQYALFGVGQGDSNFWGDQPTTLLGWYANEEQITKEMAEIHNAIAQGKPMYTLQYSAKTERRWAGVKLLED